MPTQSWVLVMIAAARSEEELESATTLGRSEKTRLPLRWPQRQQAGLGWPGNEMRQKYHALFEATQEKVRCQMPGNLQRLREPDYEAPG